MSTGRFTANLDGEFVVFLIGIRINKPLHIHKWLPVITAMPRMLTELYQQSDLGFLHAENWFGRTTIMVQYWRSMDQLLAYAKNREAAHLPAWQAINKAVGTDVSNDGPFGIWHETYAASPNRYEKIYVNMPAFGLGKAGNLQVVAENKQSARDRMGI